MEEYHQVQPSQLSLFMKDLVKTMHRIEITNDNPRGNKPYQQQPATRRQTVPGTQRWKAMELRPKTIKMDRRPSNERSNTRVPKRKTSLEESTKGEASPYRPDEFRDRIVVKESQRWSSSMIDSSLSTPPPPSSSPQSTHRRHHGNPSFTETPVGRHSSDLPSYPRRRSTQIS